MIQSVIDAYHQQNPGGTRYKVIESALGFHIVPMFAHDENGAMVATSSLLDTRITVSRMQRMPSEHIRAICEALTAASGTRVQAGGKWIDQFFAPNGAVPRYGAARLLRAEEKAPFSLEWGVSGIPAREALIQLLLSSRTTLTWALLCQPSLAGEQRMHSYCGPYPDYEGGRGWKTNTGSR